MKYSFIIFSFFFLGISLNAQSISQKKLTKHVKYLAADKREGRGTGTKGELAAAKYIAKQFKKAGLAPKGNNGSFFHVYNFKQTDPHGGVMEDAPTITTRNVVGYLDNGAANTVVIGAHFDHLGLGHDHNSLDVAPEGKIHNGADDNASGTAGVIEMARYFSKNKVKEAHNYLFICFSGEELGLFGSKKYCENPTIDLSNVSYMINMDMIGRLDPKKGLVVGGLGTAPDFVPYFDQLKFDYPLKKDSSGIGPSDHTSFYLKNIPVLFFFTGQHEDYHKPSDDIEKVNFPGLKLVCEVILNAAKSFDKVGKMTFQETKSNKSDTPDFKVTLGIMPDYTYQGKGLHVDAVREDRPAKKGGMQKDDIIIQMGDLMVDDMMGYMKALAAFNKGDKTTVKVLRGEGAAQKEVELEVEF